MEETVDRPSQPTRAMVLALIMIPISFLDLLGAGITSIPWQSTLYFVLGTLTFLAAMLILANRLLGRWIATALGVYGIFGGILIVSVVLGFRSAIGVPFIVGGLGFGLFIIGIHVLWVWMAYPLPAEQAAHRAAHASRRDARAARRAARDEQHDPTGPA